MGPEVLAEVTRGDAVESRHRGSIAAVDGNGNLLRRSGDPDAAVFLRSCAKPAQALPLLLTGAAWRFRFSQAEIAVACGSHRGEARHVRAVSSMLRKIGLTVRNLQCGAHEPYAPLAAAALKRKGEAPSPLHNNCSGKHAGMLALAVFLRTDVRRYLEPGHAVQKAILAAVAGACGVPESSVLLGTDGCGAPTFALPLRAAAALFARLVRPRRPGDGLAEAAARIVQAMRAHPRMVAGKNALDTDLMEGCPLIAKSGAEGTFAAGILPSARWPAGLGVAVKVEDGSARAKNVAAVEALRQLGIALPAESQPVRNLRGAQVGEIRPCFRLFS